MVQPFMVSVSWLNSRVAGGTCSNGGRLHLIFSVVTGDAQEWPSGRCMVLGAERDKVKRYLLYGALIPVAPSHAQVVLSSLRFQVVLHD